ncbi:MAG: hypothetical protein AB8B69_14595 [Chitinophagales bacterium]
MMYDQRNLLQTLLLLLLSFSVHFQAFSQSVYEEKDGLLVLEMETAQLEAHWKMDNSASKHTGEGYIYWEGEQFLEETGQGEITYPIYIHTPGTYRIIWRMMVGKGEDVTDHNDNWLKINADRFYGQKADGHRVMPKPNCEKLEEFDCPNGATTNGFFKVYGQDLKFIWQAATSDNDGHDLFAEFEKPGHYTITINARSSFCYLDRMVLFHTEKVTEKEATDLSQAATQATTQAIPRRQTSVSIEGNQFYLNGELTYKNRFYKGHKIEGLLFNARLVQGIFDDLNPESRAGFVYPDTKVWSADRNTDEFVAAMESWREHGLLAFTLNLQGGSPLGYGNKNWVNSTFDERGALRPAYMNRLERVLDRADELGMAVILGYFYFGQDQHLADEIAVINATDNITNWLLEQGYDNILVEITNECDIHYDHPILQPERIHELIERVQKNKQNGKRLLVSTSYSGGNLPRSNVVQIADYLLLHGNGVEDPVSITKMVEETQNMENYDNQPILFNEDDHYDFEEESYNLIHAIGAYASWGYFDFRREGDEFSAGFQSVPVDWKINSPRKISFFKKLKEITGMGE